MIEAHVSINREFTVANIQAVRTKPKKRKPKDGEECIYDLYVFGEKVDTLKGNYGCGIDLAIKMLEKYKEKENIYKVFALSLMEKK